MYLRGKLILLRYIYIIKVQVLLVTSLMEGNIDTFRMLKVKRRGLYPAPDDSIQFSIRVIFSPIFTRSDAKFQLPVD